ncbi:uncharacterized protein KY384_007205 [Bacidia gigantensis]|uniref:uncharacterized protein n=1 Tax=Bacidia gigantensis TaxID=2732470 RepID=UPI001D056E39|nr:uncharacterized protein KY384_007205 [Bacidia gigantensis]KAG8528288.1 hypothetical protein KY384_007205 [Bacidia gigantensis]
MDKRHYDVPLGQGDHNRKRSRNDMHDPTVPPATPTPASSPEKASGIPMPASSLPPPATPPSHDIDIDESAFPSSSTTPDGPSSKATRLETDSPSRSTSSKSSIKDQDLQIDEFKRALGVGWRCMEGDDVSRAATKGHQRFIEKAYPLHDVIIIAQHTEGRRLVTTDRGYFLFEENLQKAYELGSDIETAYKRIGEMTFGRLPSQPWRHGEGEPEPMRSDEIVDDAENGNKMDVD